MYQGPASLFFPEGMWQTQAVGGAASANVELLSLGCCCIDRDCDVREELLIWCRQNGYDITDEQLFCCMHLKDPAYEAWDFRFCTGHNWKIFKAVWTHQSMPLLVTQVLRSYREHTRTCTAGESYKAAFYCYMGDHESVAAIVGLRTMFLANYTDIKVQVRHRNGANGEWWRKCGTRCEWCYNYHSRREYELDLIEPILQKITLD